jgi:hypothetical protein
MWLLEKDRAQAVTALRRGLDLGMTHIDTAEMYGSGAVEEMCPPDANLDGSLKRCIPLGRVPPCLWPFAPADSSTAPASRRVATP